MSTLAVDDANGRRSTSGRRKSSPRGSLGEFSEWPFNSEQYTPDLENGADIQYAFNQLESEELGHHTAVKYLCASSNSTTVYDEVVDLQNLARTLQQRQESFQRFYFINRFLLKSDITHVPVGSKRLQISPPAFRLLFSELGIPPAFVGAVSRSYQPSGRGSKAVHSRDGIEIHDFWYILPVRVQVECTDTQTGHVSTTAGSNQMDPFHYLHLPDENVDVRGSHIGIYSQYNVATDQLSVVIISFQDGRWSRVVEEPQKRVKEVLESHQRIEADKNNFSVHLIYLTGTLRLWNNVLATFNDQLITHEKRLQNQMDNLGQQGHDFNNILNKALHTMTAHLHRYGSELERLADIIDHVEQQFMEFAHGTGQSTGNDDLRLNSTHNTRSALTQIRSQLRDTSSFRHELEQKTQNILALLFNNIQVSNDRLMVANGRAMNQMLKASRAEAQMSMRLAEEMKRDSVSMKTIALLTVFFLPGTSFAAILSMPFFNQNAWMNEASKIWLWFVLTVPSTALAFLFYQYWKRRHDAVVMSSKDAGAVEMGEILSDEGI